MLLATSRTVSLHWKDLVGWARGAVDTIKAVWSTWVVDPVMALYTTVRHRDARLAIMGAESLTSDLEVKITPR